MTATDTQPKSLEEFVRECAGLGLAVRVYTWRCPHCRAEAVAAQPFTVAVADNLAAIMQIDAILVGSHGTPRHCGTPMELLQPVTRKGALLA
jgi:hypothetical protein